MKLLLDTHTIIWWDSAPSELTPHVQDLLAEQDHSLWLSTVSIWEMLIRESLLAGRLSAGVSSDRFTV